jgi:hypothetical protein
MLKSRKSRLAAVVSVCAVAMAFAAPAQAQNQQEGLVNVALEDIVVQLPIAIAANVCDVNVVLAELADQGGTCRATADSAANAGPTGGGSTQQEGLVNVLVDDVVVQVPVALAANICDVNVAVLANVLDDESACTAVTGADATAGPTGGGRQASAAAFEPVDVDLDIGGDRVLDDVAGNDATNTNASPLELPTNPVIGAGTRLSQLR